jgi:hypothetical protein
MLPRLAVRHPCQVIAQEIDNDGRQHKKQADPDTPIKMRAFPVRMMHMMNAVADRLFVPPLVVFTLTHWVPCFLDVISDSSPPI